MPDLSARLTSFRALLAQHGIASFIQPVNDEFQNEYVPECWRRVTYISGFTGSAGTVVILQNKAALFTDGRYTLQAAAETPAALFEHHNISDKSPEKWLAENLPAGETVGFDATLHTISQVRRMREAASTLIFKPCPNLVDAIWENRPPAPAEHAKPHPLQYSGKDHNEKIREVTAGIKSSGADLCILTAPDSICWLFNIRGADVPCTPFVLCYAIVKASGEALLFIAPSKVTPEVISHLSSVRVTPESELSAHLRTLASKKVMLDPASASEWFRSEIIQAGGQIIEKADPCQLPKACKNQTEIEGTRAAHARDGRALTRFLTWLSASIGKEYIDELSAAEKLASLRAENNLYQGPSFETISGYGPNGAIVHYHSTPATNLELKPGSLYLVDSGGQYLDGTTDVTRTVAIGAPSAQQKRDFTLVLKGHIALATAVFPEGTTGAQLDALARQYLWRHGLDYDHGTGHGVGSFLSVHEGPQRISKAGMGTPLMPGMIVSNEPGYYKAGEYGIRIENLILVIEKTELNKNVRRFFGFETLTLAPIDENLVDYSLLSLEEKSWLTDYNKKSIDNAK